jgi:hypothetical protein
MQERGPEPVKLATRAEADPAASPTPAAQVTYEPAQPAITRRSFRILMALTLLNTILLGGYVLGPAFHTFGRQQWYAYQRRKAERKTAEALAAARAAAANTERGALAYALPPGTLVYDDDSARRPHPTAPATRPTPPAPWPAVVPQPAEYLALPAMLTGWGLFVHPTHTILFMHDRRASASSPARLVVVWCDAEHLLRPANEPEHGTRKFLALTLRPTSAATDLSGAGYAAFTVPAARKGGPAAIRLFAGQPDPVDASRLLIPYEMAGGGRGTIYGQLLADDTVQLTLDGPLGPAWQVGSRRTTRR